MSGQFRVPGGLEAIVLAAGQGKRLQGTVEGCKVLIEMLGETLLDRHVENLLIRNVSYVTFIVGHERSRIQGRVETRYSNRHVGTVLANRYQDGSAFSLHAMRHMMGGATTVILIEGDTLYDPTLLARVLDAPEPNVVLSDDGPNGGERRLGLSGGQVVWMGKGPVPEQYIPVRQGPGIYKIGPDAGATLQKLLEELSTPAPGAEPVEYDTLLAKLFAQHPFTPVPVGNLLWVNIDAREDLDRAMDVVWPQLLPKK